jgi:hypothetical protein
MTDWEKFEQILSDCFWSGALSAMSNYSDVMAQGSITVPALMAQKKDVIPAKIWELLDYFGLDVDEGQLIAKEEV